MYLTSAGIQCVYHWDMAHNHTMVYCFPSTRFNYYEMHRWFDARCGRNFWLMYGRVPTQHLKEFW